MSTVILLRHGRTTANTGGILAGWTSGVQLDETGTAQVRAVGERLAKVPNFVRGMVKRIYAEYARDHGIAEITPALMDTARTELGLEGM